MHEETSPPDISKNLLGQACPMNVVYAKVELAKLRKGQLLELILEEGAAIGNVTQSLEREGHALLRKTHLQDGNWSLLFRKGGLPD